jgi:hypothetical protein
LDLPIQVLHERLGVTGEDVGLAASGAGPAALAEAVEIQIRALGERERQAPAALSAVKQALEVVLVASLTNPGDVAGSERFLNPVERLWGMSALCWPGYRTPAHWTTPI